MSVEMQSEMFVGAGGEGALSRGERTVSGRREGPQAEASGRPLDPEEEAGEQKLPERTSSAHLDFSPRLLKPTSRTSRE